MDYGKQRDLLEAIKNDDVKRYAVLADGRVGSLRMGRFPILSLFYLYNAKKLTSLYEDEYVLKNGWEELPEPPELSTKFSKVAGKALRLYQNEVVSPLEMALLLGKTGKVRRLCPSVRLTSAQKDRMVSLYSVNYSLPVRFTDRGIEIPNPPMGYEKKKKIFLAAASLILVAAVLISTPFIVNVFVPFIGADTPYEEGPVDPTPDPTPDPAGDYIEAADFSEIDFTSTKAYKLTSDVVLPVGFFVETVNCTLDGDGKKVTSTGGCPVFGTVVGTVKNIDFVITSGTWETTENFSFVAQYNRGAMENLSLNVSGKLVGRAGENAQEELYLAGFALSNTATNASTGLIKGCSAQYDLELECEVAANASFAGICAVNNRTVQECSTSGEITSKNCDVGGICVKNGYLLYQDVNEASISQQTEQEKWSPLCAGVTIKNTASFYVNSTVRECENKGAVTVRSDFRSEGAFEEGRDFAGAESGGIVGNNDGGMVYDCVNSGAVTATSVECVTYAGGICAMTQTLNSSFSTSTPTLSGCVNSGVVTVETERTSGFSAGICAVGQSAAYTGCINESAGKVTLRVTSCEQENVLGGACGVVVSGNGSGFSSCKNYADVSVNASVAAVYVGGIAGISSTVSGSENFGDIAVVSDGNTAYVGGLVARANGNVTGSRSDGEITVSDAAESTVHLGGLVGYTVFTVSECYAKGVLTATGGTVYLGGAAGLCAIEDYASYGQTYVYCGKVIDSVADCTLVAHEGEKAYVGGIAGYVRHKVYSYATTDENGDPINKESLFAGGVAGSYSFSTLSAGENGVTGGVAGGVDRRIADENAEKKYFDSNGYLAGSGYQGVGAYCDEDTSTAGGDLNAAPYVLREEMESLSAVRTILSRFSET